MIKKCLLKGLCIVGLTLLPISFSSAYSYKQDFDIPDTFVKGNMTYVILDNFNFSTFYQNTTLNHILFSESNLSSNGRNRLHSFFAFYDGKPYLYADYIHDGSRSYVYQGFPTKFCLASAGSGESVCVPSGWSCPKNTDISVFYNAGKLTHGTYYGYGDFNSTYQPWTYCVSDNTYDYCFSVNASSSDCGNYLTGSLNVPGTSIEQLQSFDWSSSPFSSSSSKVPDVPTGKKVYTNQDIIDGFNAMGLTDEFCYGGFPISDIFENGQVPQEFVGYVWGSGAMILDIRDQYKSAYNNDPVSFIRSFYVAFENDNYNSFYGYPKALYGFFNQYFALNLQGRGFNSFMSDFTILDIWEYCNLEFKSDHNANYTGDTWKPKLAYNNSENINNQGRFNFSGNNALFSGNLSGFDDPKDFFSSLIGIFQGGLGDLGTTRQPLLPSYILVFLFAIIFIRMISH